MDLLGAALAFALTMLALSIVVSTSVETLHRIVGLREKGLRLMLRHFYDAELALHVDATSIALPAAQQTFLDAMTLNRAPTGEASARRASTAPVTHAAEDDRRFLSWIWGGRRLGSLSLDDFMGRLGDSPVGDAVAQVGQDFGAEAIDTVLRDLAHKFDEFGREASEYFAARARLLSVLIALVIAWQCYVNPYVLFSKFLTSPALVQSVIQRQDELLRRSDPNAPAASSKEAKQLVASMTELGVPLGWTPDRLEQAGFGQWYLIAYPREPSRAVPTIAWLVLGGLLVGLGSPFWRDIVLSLTNLRGDSSKQAALSADATVAGVDRIAVAADRFLTASRARAVVTGDATRIDLDAAVG